MATKVMVSFPEGQELVSTSACSPLRFVWTQTPRRVAL